MRIESLHLPQGAAIHSGSLTMVKCTSTRFQVNVSKGARLVMEDCRIFVCEAQGVICCGHLQATRCKIEDNGRDGVHVVANDQSLLDFSSWWTA